MVNYNRMKKLGSKIFNYDTKSMSCSSCGESDFNYDYNSCNNCGIKLKSNQQNYLLKTIIDNWYYSFISISLIIIFIDLSWGKWKGFFNDWFENFQLTDLLSFFMLPIGIYLFVLFFNVIIIALSYLLKWFFLKIQLIYSTDEWAYRFLLDHSLTGSAKKRRIESWYNETIAKIVYATICITITFLYFFIKYT